MTAGPRARLAWSLFALYLVLAAGTVAFGVLTGQWGDIPWLAVFAAFPLVGALIASRGVGGPIGWICLAVGLAASATGVTEGYTAYALKTNPGSLPGGAYAAVFSSFSWVSFVGLIAIFLVAYFPDGRLVSPRWRPLPWIGAAAMITTATAIALTPGVHDEYPAPVANPIGIEGAKDLFTIAHVVGLVSLFACVAAAVISVVVRFRRSRGEERQQLKWFVSAVGVSAAVFFLSIPASGISPRVSGVLEVVSVIAWVTLPLAAGVAILRYRLYDLDVVINKALVFGALAVFITAVYVGIVVGVSALVGTAGHPSIVLSIIATAIVAVAFQPARERAHRFANRLVYGKRATPYDVLAEVSEQASTVAAVDDVLERVARAVADGTGAKRSDVWVVSGFELRRAASWPESADGPPRLMLDNGRLPDFPSTDGAVPVRHRNELLGALAIAKPRGESVTPADEKLLNDLAAQAGLVLRNVGLTSELLARLEELRASRQRLVTAQDEERRRLERDLHDGAQQHLVALKVKLNLAARQAGETPLKNALLALQSDADEAIEALRDLARGIYPPLLADAGLVAALEAHARKLPFRVAIEADEIGRYPQDVEAAVYFCCLEALQNVSKYSHAAHAVVRLVESNAGLRFTVEDDGAGFDPAATPRGSGLQNMADRVEALGGTFELVSSPGTGTVVAGSLPLAGHEAMPPQATAAGLEPAAPLPTA